MKRKFNTLKPVVSFQASSPMMVVGSTNCGKMHWIHQLLENDMFMELVNSILYCYGVYKEFFDSMCENISCPIQFYQGLLSMKDIDRIHDGQFHIIVLDDMMECIVKMKIWQNFSPCIVIIRISQQLWYLKTNFKRKTSMYHFFKHTYSCFIWK